MNVLDEKPWVWGEFRYTEAQRNACASQVFYFLPRAHNEHGQVEGDEFTACYFCGSYFIANEQRIDHECTCYPPDYDRDRYRSRSDA